MTRYLIRGVGHRRIAMILAEFGPSKRRALGYSSVMREAGLEPEFVIDSAYPRNPARARCKETAGEERDRVTAVFGASDMLALGAMQAAKSAGLAIRMISPSLDLTIFRGQTARPHHSCVSRNSDLGALGRPHWSTGCNRAAWSFRQKPRIEIEIIKRSSV